MLKSTASSRMQTLPKPEAPIKPIVSHPQSPSPAAETSNADHRLWLWDGLIPKSVESRTRLLGIGLMLAQTVVGNEEDWGRGNKCWSRRRNAPRRVPFSLPAKCPSIHLLGCLVLALAFKHQCQITILKYSYSFVGDDPCIDLTRHCSSLFHCKKRHELNTGGFSTAYDNDLPTKSVNVPDLMVDVYS
jgi:hypothetical protein